MRAFFLAMGLVLLTINLSAQKKKTNEQTDKAIYGLTLKTEWPDVVYTMETDAFFTKGKSLYVKKGYVITKTESDKYKIHEDGAFNEITKYEEVKVVGTGPGVVFVLSCLGCTDGCLVGWSGVNPYCTGCNEGVCNAQYEVLLDPSATRSEMYSPSF